MMRLRPFNIPEEERMKPLRGRNYQVCWEDIEAWLQQLYEEHGVYVNVEILLQGVPTGLKPAVRVNGYYASVGHSTREAFSEYRVFELSSTGEVERDALHILSQALLALDNDRWRAEQGNLWTEAQS
jgi:hypothetical protein